MLLVLSIRCEVELKVKCIFCMKGTIAKLIADRGFGFIKPAEEGEKEVFFHARVIEGTTFEELSEGQAVTYEVEDGPKGPAASTVSVA